MFILKGQNLKCLLDSWSREFEVFSPQADEGQVMLLPFEEDKFTMDYVNLAFPPKEYMFKQRQILFNWESNNGNINIEIPDKLNLSRRVYFGIRPCDAYGILYMDKFFLEGYRDEFYEKNRNAAYIAAVNCINPGENCFCSSVGTGPFAKGGYDILFTPLDDVYLVEVGSAKGEELVAASKGLLEEFDEELLHKKELLEKSVLDTFKTRLETDNARGVLEENFKSPTWQQLSKDCVACTGCTSLCPTCTCFNVVEESTGPDKGCRVRYWDSCQTDSFTRNAGGHNPRTKEIRVKYRIYDKFKYIEDKFEMKGCTGCGRCINVCPASINVVKIINDFAEGNLSTENNGGK